ncbi:peptidoglycan-associated lipoprotein [Idiomarina sp. A28L]|uniref:peptidoglycan-associated lipoprotein Pal n=1 Tax=Idiomarina sp. A28L TaxID=1036674 RepID=UPI0002138D4F|nr:peptidoglycan-associated lipoprotein Pal [Idiomarina sp. A28L]EGN74652.1 peptidoglycan-associated lipoprotein [Idiomarina sp. A28L]
MQLNKFLKTLAVLVSVATLAACSSSPDEDMDSSSSGRTGSEQTDGTRGGVTTGAADRMQSPEEQRQQRYAELRQEHIIYFDFDESTVRGEFAELLTAHADYLARNPSVTVVIEGHTDERGTPEYNIALGERRGNSVATYLRNLGVLSSQIEVVSFGEEKPLARGSSERAWSQNRRAVLVY